MKRVNNRVLKLEELITLKYERPDIDLDSISDEEAEEIVHEVLSGPPRPLYVWTRLGYVDINKIRSEKVLAEIYYKNIKENHQLYTKDELLEIGIEPYEERIDWERYVHP